MSKTKIELRFVEDKVENLILILMKQIKAVNRERYEQNEVEICTKPN